jgi:hypothetical protein
VEGSGRNLSKAQKLKTDILKRKAELNISKPEEIQGCCNGNCGNCITTFLGIIRALYSGG